MIWNAARTNRSGDALRMSQSSPNSTRSRRAHAPQVDRGPARGRGRNRPSRFTAGDRRTGRRLDPGEILGVGDALVEAEPLLDVGDLRRRRAARRVRVGRPGHPEHVQVPVLRQPEPGEMRMDAPLDHVVALETRGLELPRPPRERRDREMALDRRAVGVAVQVVVRDRAFVVVAERAVVVEPLGPDLHVEPAAGAVAIRPERRNRRDDVLASSCGGPRAARGARPRAGGARASRTARRLRTRPARTGAGGAGCRTARDRARRARPDRARTDSRRRRSRRARAHVRPRRRSRTHSRHRACAAPAGTATRGTRPRRRGSRCACTRRSRSRARRSGAARRRRSSPRCRGRRAARVRAPARRSARSRRNHGHRAAPSCNARRTGATSMSRALTPRCPPRAPSRTRRTARRWGTRRGRACATGS